MLDKKIIIAGAGAIGNYIGLQLRKSRHSIVFLGSKRVVDAVNRSGISLEYPNDSFEFHTANEVNFTTDPACCKDADLIIITTKSLVTPTLIEQISEYVGKETVLLTLQNGISNAVELKAAFPDNEVLAGMVTFNVIEVRANTFRLTTSGDIYMQPTAPSLLPLFKEVGMTAHEEMNMAGMLWSKLLLNLVNPLNAISGNPLKQNLENRQFRQQWVLCMREGLAVLKASNIEPVKITPIPTQYLPFMLDLPDWIYRLLARKMTDMDPRAKSSMAQDIERGKATEIDHLTGEIIRLGKTAGVPTPENEKVYQQILSLTENTMQRS